MDSQALESLPDTMVNEFHHIISSILRDKFNSKAKALGVQINQVQRKNVLDVDTIELLREFCQIRNEVAKSRKPIKNERAFIKNFVKIHEALIRASFEKVPDRPDSELNKKTPDCSEPKQATRENNKNKNKKKDEGNRRTKTRTTRRENKARFEDSRSSEGSKKPKRNSVKILGKEKVGETYWKECNNCGQMRPFVKAPIKVEIFCKNCGNPLGRI